jgi:hypothetical protein
MSSLAFLAVAVALSLLGSLILWLRYRRPRSLEAGIDEFTRELKALAPDRKPGEKRTG